MSDTETEGSIAFVRLCLEVSSYAQVRTANMKGEGSDAANALFHSLALFLSSGGTPEEAEQASREFAKELPALVRRYADAQQGNTDG